MDMTLRVAINVNSQAVGRVGRRSAYRVDVKIFSVFFYFCHVATFLTFF